MMKQKLILFFGLFFSMLIFYGVLELEAGKSQQKKKFEEMMHEEKIEDENSREMLRAFYTAPPVIPHEITAETSKDCLKCHLNVTRLEDGRVAMPTPHPNFTSCQQCHVAKDLSGTLKVENEWRGLEEPKYGERWFATTPPMIPHRLFLRENCLSCHSAEHPNMRMRTPHPNRTACLQCHVSNREREF